MKKLLYTFLATLALAACDFFPFESGNEGTVIQLGNINANNSTNKYAKRIEVPAITDEELFIAHTTTVNGKENVTYSIVHNPERKHCRWTAFTFDPSNREKNWNRNNWPSDGSVTTGTTPNGEATHSSHAPICQRATYSQKTKSTATVLFADTL